MAQLVRCGSRPQATGGPALTADRWLLVSGDFVPTGGMDVANWGLAMSLAASVPVTVVAHRVADDLQALPAVTVEHVRRPYGRHLLGAPLLDRAGRRRAAQGNFANARVVVNGGNCRWFDVAWVHYVHAAYRPQQPAGTLRRLKAALHRRRSLTREREVLRRSRVVVCNSRLTARHVIERVGVDREKVRVVYYGCDPDRFAAVSEDDRAAARAALEWDNGPWTLFVGALGDRRKGFDTLYQAWKQLSRGGNWDARLAVAGHGAELPAWQRQAQDDGLADRVRFLGFRDDMPRVYAASDLLVHPARYEAYGLGVHEALCRGLPALVSADAGVAERFPSALGDMLLADPEDVTALADRLRCWQRERESWRARVAPLAATLRARTWRHMTDEFVAAVEPSASMPAELERTVA